MMSANSHLVEFCDHVLMTLVRETSRLKGIFSIVLSSLPSLALVDPPILQADDFQSYVIHVT